jgi:transposase-like protein
VIASTWSVAYGMSRLILCKCRHYETEVILLCARWYLRYWLIYRGLEEVITERDLSVDNTTIYRWWASPRKVALRHFR